jgi:hypothetical protein
MTGTSIPREGITSRVAWPCGRAVGLETGVAIADTDGAVDGDDPPRVGDTPPAIGLVAEPTADWVAPTAAALAVGLGDPEHAATTTPTVTSTENDRRSIDPPMEFTWTPSMPDGVDCVNEVALICQLRV